MEFTVPKHVERLVSTFQHVLQISQTMPLVDDFEYMQLTELRFALKNIRELSAMQLYQSYSKSNVLTLGKNPIIDESITGSAGIGTTANIGEVKQTVVDCDDLGKKIDDIDVFLTQLYSYIKHRLSLNLNATDGTSSKQPRIIRLCSLLALSNAESDLIHLLVVAQGSCNSLVLNCLTEDDYLRRMSGYQRLVNLSEVDVDLFCDAERLHIKEGLILVDEESGAHFNLRLPRTAVQLLYGRQVKADDLLKVAQTSIEELLREEKTQVPVARQTKPLIDDLANPDSLNASPVDDTLVVYSNSRASKSPRVVLLPRIEFGSKRRSDSRRLVSSSKRIRLDLGSNSDEEDSAIDDSIDEIEVDEDEEAGSEELIDIAMGLPDIDKPATEDCRVSQSRASRNSITSTDALTEVDLVDPGQDEFLPYVDGSQLEYLEECFQVVALMIRGNAARLKDDMRKEGTKMNAWDYTGEVKHGRRELQAKLRVHEARVMRRVLATRKAGLSPPRLEVMAERLQLDAFEKRLILLLIGKTVSPVVKMLMDTLDGGARGDDTLSVGQALAILCQDFHTQVANRRYFYKSGRLMTNGIISLSRSRWHQGSGDLTDNRITLDRRVLDDAVGLDSEINELVEGSDLYTPQVDLNQVVLPEGHIESVLSHCRAYDAFIKYIRLSKSSLKEEGTSEAVQEEVTTDLSESVQSTARPRLAYGNGLVVLLCGKSGTGKTMTVNAIAKELGKKVLLVDFGGLAGKKSDGGGDLDADLRGLFREAKMGNAVLFFDECETVFRSRDRGGDRLLNSLLTEIEKHEGIVFLATNRPYDLDEAMHRRITAVVEYRPPDYLMRQQIWENLLGVCGASTRPGEQRMSLQLNRDVDIGALAVKYELTGGFIKNAVQSALLSALARNQDDPIISQDDLIAGCKLQMRGSLHQKGFEPKLVPKIGTDELFLHQSVKDVINAVVRFEKTRACVHGSWGKPLDFRHTSSELDHAQKACICALAGPSGSGKRTMLSAIAYDLGKPVRCLHTIDILFNSSEQGAGLSMLTAAVQDARLSDSVIAIDGFEHALDSSKGTEWKLDVILSRMLSILHSFPGCIILICNLDNPQNLTLQRDFASKLFAFIKLSAPPPDIRAKLWKSFIPARAPLAADVNCIELGRRFELQPGSIQAAVSRACSEAAGRISNAEGGPAKAIQITQQDFISAGSSEFKKLTSGNVELISSMFM